MVLLIQAGAPILSTPSLPVAATTIIPSSHALLIAVVKDRNTSSQFSGVVSLIMGSVLKLILATLALLFTAHSIPEINPDSEPEPELSRT